MAEIESYMFKARTNEGFIFKVLTELLQNNIKVCCFVINNEGMNLRMSDNLMKVLIDIHLSADKFQLYKYKFHEKKMIGLNLSHLHKMLKSVKKKDTVELFIASDSDNNFGIRVIPKENTRITTSYVKIQNIQNVSINLPVVYDKSHIIASTDYQKMIKDMNSIGNVINVTNTEHTITFKCIADSIYSREVTYGNINDDDTHDVLFEDNYYTEQLLKLVKISGLSNKIYIHTKQDNPLYIKTNVGSIGVINIYIKSKDQINNNLN